MKGEVGSLAGGEVGSEVSGSPKAVQVRYGVFVGGNNKREILTTVLALIGLVLMR